MTKGWLFWLGFGFIIAVGLFIFIGIPLIGYLGITRKVKFLPSLDALLKHFPNALDDLEDRPPYNKLDYSTGLSVLYVELIASLWLVKAVKIFKRGKV